MVMCVCVYLYSPGHVEKVNYKNPIYMLRSDGEGLNTKKVKVKHIYIYIYYICALQSDMYRVAE